MIRTLVVACTLLVALLAVTVLTSRSLSAQAEPGKDAVGDQSPPLPAPKDLTFIDQGATDKRLAGYRTPAGFQVEIVADAPTVINPVGMAFADDGTPHVLEWRPSPGDEWRQVDETVKYRDGTTRTVATMRKKVKDVVKVLSASKPGGPWDTAKVVLEDELPSSILLHDGWLYLSGRGTVRRFKQSKPGGPYDIQEVIAKGFCGFHHHQVSGMTIGNDGWLYLTSGDDDNIVEGSDGSRATVLRTGGVFRCRPDGSKMHVFAIGFRNPYRDVAFDLGGNMFHIDNDNEDGSKFQGCRLMHIPEGADFGWRLLTGARCCRPDRVRGAASGELPGKMPPLLRTGRGAPAGLLIYNDTRLPEAYRGLLFYPDVYRRVIRAYRVQSIGASFRVTEEFPFLSAPKDDLFRPCQMVLGPDGAIYVVDWRTNSGGAGKLWGDGVHGRIYRIRWTGTKESPALPLRPIDSWQKVTTLKDDELLKVLASEDASDRERARREFVRRGEKNRPALLKLLEGEETPLVARIAAMGSLQSMYNADVQAAFLRLLEESDVELQRLLAEAISLCAPAKDRAAHNGLLKALANQDAAVRRAVAIAMGRLAGPGAGDNLAAALSFDDGKDEFLRDGIHRGLEMLGKPGMDALIALADSGVQKDTDRVVEAFLGMRGRAAFNALPTLLKHMHVNGSQRADLIRSSTNYLLDPPVSLDPIVEWIVARPKEIGSVRQALLEILATPGTVKGPKAAAWVLDMLREPNDAVRLAAIHAAGAMKLDGAATLLAKQVANTTLGSAERIAALRALRQMAGKDAVAALRDVLADDGVKPPEDESLRREALQTLAAIDPTTARGVARRYLNHKDLAWQREAVGVLGATGPEAREIGTLFLAKKLSGALLPEVSEALRKHASKDPRTAKLLAEVMKSGLKIHTSPSEIARLRKLVETQGNAERGKALYLDGKALACINCHTMEGVGGSVGPDLTRMWDTHSVEKIIEALIEPSKEIKEGFQTYQATTKRGQVYQGLKVAQTATEVVIREASGRDVRIDQKDLEELTALKTSLMPDNVVSQVSFAGFLDLVAFLRNRSAQESLRGMALDFWVVGPFPADGKSVAGLPGKADPTIGVDGKMWQVGRASANGLLDLRSILGAARTRAYVLTNVYAPKAQKARMHLGSSDAVRVWVHGAAVHERTGARQPRPDQDRIEVPLKQGWNPVLVEVIGGDRDHSLYLRFAGTGLRVTRSPAPVR